MEIIAFAAVLVIAIGMVVYAIYIKNNPTIKLCTDGDEDIKIADGNFKHEPKSEDSADQAAEEYLWQKDAGNIEIAGKLGELLAKELWSVAQELIMNEENIYTNKEIHQKILLRSYVVNNFIADSAPYPILGETALSVFYNTLEDLSSVLFQHVSDTVGFSLYILNQRTDQSLEEIGRIYAKLSGAENNLQTIKEGNEIYRTFYERCREISKQHISYNI